MGLFAEIKEDFSNAYNNDPALTSKINFLLLMIESQIDLRPWSSFLISWFKEFSFTLNGGHSLWADSRE